MKVAFADYVLDTDEHQLTRNGVRVPIPPKAAELVEGLVAAHPAAASYADLHARLWPSAGVNPANVHSLVSDLRAAIGDASREVIRTVHGFGYALATDITVHSAAPRAFVVMDGREIPLRNGMNKIGRGRNQARIVIDGDAAAIEDTKHGAWLNEQRVIGTVPLHDGDQILVGDSAMTFWRRIPGRMRSGD